MTTTSPDREQQIVDECTALAAMLIEKNAAYGDSALNPVRVFSKADAVEQLRVRIDDKLSRLMRGNDAGEDVVLDLLGYLVLLRIATKPARREPPRNELFTKWLEGQPEGLAGTCNHCGEPSRSDPCEYCGRGVADVVRRSFTHEEWNAPRQEPRDMETRRPSTAEVLFEKSWHPNEEFAARIKRGDLRTPKDFGPGMSESPSHVCSFQARVGELEAQLAHERNVSATRHELVIRLERERDAAIKKWDQVNHEMSAALQQRDVLQAELTGARSALDDQLYDGKTVREWWEKACVYGAIAAHHHRALTHLSTLGGGRSDGNAIAREALEWRHSSECRGVPQADLDAFTEMLKDHVIYDEQRKALYRQAADADRQRDAERAIHEADATCIADLHLEVSRLKALRAAWLRVAAAAGTNDQPEAIAMRVEYMEEKLNLVNTALGLEARDSVEHVAEALRDVAQNGGRVIPADERGR